MDENLEFKNIIASSILQGTDKIMYLLPYAKDLKYEDGTLSMVLEFVNNVAETEVEINLLVADELQEIFGKIMYGEV